MLNSGKFNVLLFQSFIVNTESMTLGKTDMDSNFPVTLYYHGNGGHIITKYIFVWLDILVSKMAI